MSLRSKFFALTYDRQIAKTEQAGLHAFRERLLARRERRRPRDRRRDRAEPALLRPGGQVPDDHRAAAPRCCAAWSGGSIEQRPSATVLRAPAEDLPFEDHSFDVAVSTLVLCGVDDQPRALRELRRVLRPGGRLLFLEHLRSEDPGTARLQDRMNWLNRLVVCCDCNRPTLDSIRGAGFTVAQVEHTDLPKAPTFVRPTVLGSATAPAAAPSGYSPPTGSASQLTE